MIYTNRKYKTYKYELRHGKHYKQICKKKNQTIVFGWPAGCLASQGGETQTRGFGATCSDAQQTQTNKQENK